MKKGLILKSKAQRAGTQEPDAKLDNLPHGGGRTASQKLPSVLHSTQIYTHMCTHTHTHTHTHMCTHTKRQINEKQTTKGQLETSYCVRREEFKLKISYFSVAVIKVTEEKVCLVNGSKGPQCIMMGKAC